MQKIEKHQIVFKQMEDNLQLLPHIDIITFVCSFLLSF